MGCMHRKCLALLILVVSATGQIAAQSSEDVFSEVDDRLYVEEYKATTFLVLAAITNSHWRAWHGTERITPAEFFSIAGDESAAAQARANRRTGLWIVGGGAAAWVAGMAFGPIGSAFTEHDSARLLAGGITGGIGFVVSMLGVRVMLRPVCSIERAYLVAAAYNDD